MADIATLGIQVTTNGVQQSAADLDKLAASSDKAASSTTKLSQASSDAAKKYSSPQYRQQADDLAKLAGQIDPTVAALGRLDAQQQKLSAFKKSGMLSADDFNSLNSAIESNRAKLAQAAEGMAGFTLNTSFARRELGRLASDVANGNWGRFEQTSLTLANSSGLLSAAFSGAGLAVTGTLGAIALFVAAAAKGALANDQLNTSLIATGNYAGTNTQQLNAMAKSISGALTPIGEARDAVAALASSGRFTAQQIAQLAQATVDGGTLMGKSVEQMVAEFTKLQESPVEASEALNEQYHYLTTATLQQIDALQKQGDAAAAASLALTSYADALRTRAAQAVDQLGTLQQAWDSLKSSASFAWDAMLGIGRPTDALGKLNDQYDNLYKTITAVQDVAAGKKPGLIGSQYLPASLNGANGAWGMFSSSPTAAAQAQAQQMLPQLEAQAVSMRQSIDAMQAKETANTASASVSAQVQKDGQDAIKTLDQLGISLDGVKNKQDKVNEAAQALYKIYLAGGKLPAGVNFNGAAADMPQGAGWDKIKNQLLYGSGTRTRADPMADLNSVANKVYTDYNAAQLGDSGADSQQVALYKQEVTLLQQIADAGGKAIEKHADLATVQARVADLTSKTVAAFDLEAKQLQTKNAAALKAYQDAIDSQIAAKQKQLDLQVASVGMGDKEAQQMQALAAIEAQSASTIEQLQRQRTQKGANTQLIDGQIAAQKAALPVMVKQQQDAYKAMDAAQSDWENGAIKAMENIRDEGANVAGMTQNLFTDAFNSMDDALANFATTGKLNFRSLATSILDDLVKMETKILASQALQSILGAFGAGSIVSGSTAAAWTSQSMASDIAVNAKGGVYDSPSLSAYSGQIVSKPTLFAFAQGAGLMGEAGPEAILPLRRGPDGKLGVTTASGNGLNFNQTINVDAGGGATQQTSGADSSALAKQFADRMKEVSRQTIANEQRPGGLLWRMQHG